MTEQELLELCRDPKRRKRLFWTSEIYGFGSVLRKYGVYPDSLPLNIYFSHGVTMHEKPAPHELENKAPVMFYFSPRLVKAYKSISKKPCYSVISPNVYYRRSRKIVQDINAKGTLAFFAHTTPDIDNMMDVKSYIHQLKNLPEKYQPVSVCLHYHDVNKGFYKLFYDARMEVVTVGNPFLDNFIERFYSVVKKFKYATSNEVGSYTYYCAEMGIPFFLYGDEPELYNNSDTNIEKGKYTSYKNTEPYMRVKELFTQPVETITTAQREYVEEELGVNNTVSRIKFASILYKTYLNRKYLDLKMFVYQLITFKWLIKNKKLFKYFQRLKFHYRNYKNYGYEFASSLRANSREKKVQFLGNTLLYTNEFWFLHSMREIFLDKTYWFKSDTTIPLIIDCGSNIGLSLIYFKQLYPSARIIAFEPDPTNFEVLKKNVASFGLNDIQLNNQAIWSSDTILPWVSSENSVGSRLEFESVGGHATRNVQAAALSTYLKNNVVDFLKIDIEGAELEVINSCKDYLANVRNLFIEYHSLPHEPQRLPELLQIIQNAGFRYYIKEAWENIRYPYAERNPDLFDLQLNIFAYK